MTGGKPIPRLSRVARRLARSWPALLVALLAGVLLLFRWRQGDALRAPFDFDATHLYRVERAIDGDTLLLEGNLRVRLLGVDTPETKDPTQPAERLGAEAAAFTRRFVSGVVVRLEFDRSRRDAQRRVLAYVYVDDRCLNEELIRAGFNRTETVFPYSERMRKRFVAAEDEARRGKRGLWAEPAVCVVSQDSAP